MTCRCELWRHGSDLPGAMSEPCAGASPKPFRRIEVYTGVGRRRFTIEEKLEFVAQMTGCDNISELARRNDLRPSQLFTWRRELRYAAQASQDAGTVPEPMFVPAVVEPPREPVAAPAKHGRLRRRGASTAIELVIDGVAVKIARCADAELISAVIDALKPRAWSGRVLMRGCWWRPGKSTSARARTRLRPWSRRSMAQTRSRA